LLRKALKPPQIKNEVCFEKLLDWAGKNQTLVFVHSRYETVKTAKFLRDMAVEKEAIAQFIKPDTLRPVTTGSGSRSLGYFENSRSSIAGVALLLNRQLSYNHEIIAVSSQAKKHSRGAR